MAYVTPLLFVLAGYAGFRLLQFALLVLNFARARLQTFRVTRCEREELPQQVLPLFDAAAELLAARGFEFAGTALHVVYASVFKDGSLATTMRGDVEDFARHVCARGCSTLELSGRFERR